MSDKLENGNYFSFKLIDVKFYKKDNEDKAILVCYCNFGYVVNIYCSKDKAVDVKTYALNNKEDITPLVRIFYDSKKNDFYYTLK